MLRSADMGSANSQVQHDQACNQLDSFSTHLHIFLLIMNCFVSETVLSEHFAQTYEDY